MRGEGSSIETSQLEVVPNEDLQMIINGFSTDS